MRIKVEELVHRHRKSSAALRVKEFEVAAGEELCLAGPSGCGKTTFLHLLAGILVPHAGKIQYDAIDITDLSEAARDRFRAQKIGYVFQSHHLLQSLTALENLLLVLDMAGVRGDEAHSRATEALSRLGVGHRVDARPERLSLGEQQRTALARAIVHSPAVILADEPTASLDQENAALAIDLLREEAKRCGAALLLVSHDDRIRDRFARTLTMEELVS